MQILCPLLVLFSTTALSKAFALEKVSEVLTQGAAGFEHFLSTNDDTNSLYLVVANFWDGTDAKMGALSRLYEVHQRKASENKRSIELKFIQDFPSKGAHGADGFAITHAHSNFKSHLLVIPNYYDCEMGFSCKAIKTYLWDDSLGLFQNSFTIESSGPGQTDHFYHNGVTYMAVAENFVSRISVYRIELRPNSHTLTEPGTAIAANIHSPGATATLVQTLPLTGVASCALASIDGQQYLIGASYHDNGWHTQSKVYHFDDTALLFHDIQTLPSKGAHDAETVEFKGLQFLVLSEDRDEGGPTITSNIYLWDFMDRRYVHFQAISTDGAHAAEFFIIKDWLFLAIANFGDRQGRRYDSASPVFELQLSDHAFNNSVCSSRFRNEKICDDHLVGSSGCFVSQAISEMETSKQHQDEECVYSHCTSANRITECHDAAAGIFTAGDSCGLPQKTSCDASSIGTFILVSQVDTFGATDWEYFSFGGNHYLAVSEEGDLQRGSSSSYPSSIYAISF